MAADWVVHWEARGRPSFCPSLRIGIEGEQMLQSSPVAPGPWCTAGMRQGMGQRGAPSTYPPCACLPSSWQWASKTGRAPSQKPQLSLVQRSARHIMIGLALLSMTFCLALLFPFSAGVAPLRWVALLRCALQVVPELLLWHLCPTAMLEPTDGPGWHAVGGGPLPAHAQLAPPARPLELG